MSFLSIENISKKYGRGEDALSDFSLEVSKGHVWSLVGESGSGKSTLLRIISGNEIQDQGTVYLKGNKILNPSEKLVPGYDEVQLIHQQNNLYSFSTVEENISRPLLLYDKAYKEERVKSVLNLLQLDQHKQKLPEQLSGGQQQKVAIGRALSTEPEVLLLDEPFSSLDNIQKRELIGELKAIFEQLAMTVIFVTHDIDDAMVMTDHLCIIKKGKIIQKGSSSQLHKNPENRYVAKLFSDINPLPELDNAYLRPFDLRIKRDRKGIEGEVMSCQYLVPYNLLTVRLKDSGFEWKVNDRKRDFEKGEQIFLSYEKDDIIRF